MSRALGRALWRHNQIVIVSLEVRFRVILGNNLIRCAKNGEDGRREGKVYAENICTFSQNTCFWLAYLKELVNNPALWSIVFI